MVAPGLLITNAHVIESCQSIEINSTDGKRPAIIVDQEPMIDLALLRVYGMPSDIAPIRVEPSVELGEGVMVFGFPLTGALSSTGNFTIGNVSSLRGMGDMAGVLQITAPVQPGNSGGPILDDHGRVVGVVKSKLDVIQAARVIGDIPQNVNFGIALPVLIDFLEKNNVDYRVAENTETKKPVEIARDAQNFTYLVRCEASRATAASPARPPARSQPPANSDPLTAAIQRELNRLGFNAGQADGLLGPRTRSAILNAQRAFGLPQNGLPSTVLLERLRRAK